MNMSYSGSNNLSKRIFTLDSIRFFMCLTIVIRHMFFWGSQIEGQPNLYSKLFVNSNTAVTYFFVIAGFGLTYRYFAAQKNALDKISVKSLWNYGRNRVGKIYWLYAVTMIVMMLFVYGMKILQHEPLFDGAQDIVYTVIGVILSPFLLQSATGIGSISVIYNGVAWFLSTLFILYCVYPLLERLNVKHIVKVKRKGFLIPLAIILDMLAIYLFRLIGKNEIFIDIDCFSPYARIFDFGLGIILCDVFVGMKQKGSVGMKQKGSAIKSRFKMTVIEAVTATATVVWWMLKTYVNYEMYSFEKEVIDRIVVSAVILIFAFEAGRISELLKKPLPVTLGKNTTYVFLLHIPFINIIGRGIKFVWGINIYTRIIATVLVVAATVIATVICNKIDAYIASRKASRLKQSQI